MRFASGSVFESYPFPSYKMQFPQFLSSSARVPFPLIYEVKGGRAMEMLRQQSWIFYGNRINPNEDEGEVMSIWYTIEKIILLKCIEFIDDL